MANIKTTFTFSAEGNFGWTETFYQVGDDIGTLFAEASSTAAGGYLRRRQQMLTENCWIKGVTCSDEAVLRDSKAKVIPKSQGKGLIPKPITGEQPYDALLLRCEAGNTRRRGFLLRGIPVGLVSEDNEYIGANAFITNLNNYMEAIRDRLHGAIRIKTPGPKLFPSAIDVGLDLKSLTITFAAPLPAGLATNAIINVAKMGQAANVNGLWKIAKVDGLVVTTFPKLREIFGSPVPTGSVTVMAITYGAITSIQPVRGGKRDTGRPSGALAGKARVRKS